jgi:hypothetical protein
MAKWAFLEAIRNGRSKRHGRRWPAHKHHSANLTQIPGNGLVKLWQSTSLLAKQPWFRVPVDLGMSARVTA